MMPVEYAVSERIATITLNRPEAMNSLDPESLVELNDAFQRANADQEPPRRSQQTVGTCS